jgi:hypothetical protein
VKPKPKPAEFESRAFTVEEVFAPRFREQWPAPAAEALVEAIEEIEDGATKH